MALATQALVTFFAVFVFEATVLSGQDSYPLRNRDLGFESTIEVVELYVCSRVSSSFSGNGTETPVKKVELRTSLRLRISNVGTVPLLLSQNAYQIVGAKVFLREENGNKGRMILNQRVNFSPISITETVGVPVEKGLTVLKQGKSEDFHVENTIWFKGDQIQSLRQDLMAEYEIITWSERREHGLALKKTLVPKGNLLIDEIRTKAIPINLPNTLSQPCKN